MLEGRIDIGWLLPSFRVRYLFEDGILRTNNLLEICKKNFIYGLGFILHLNLVISAPHQDGSF
jgi:hypothetical protein